jgi:hypothetical protein
VLQHLEETTMHIRIKTSVFLLGGLVSMAMSLLGAETGGARKTVPEQYKIPEGVVLNDAPIVHGEPTTEKIGQVQINDIGLARLNRWRHRQGKEPITTAACRRGEELEATVTARMDSSELSYDSPEVAGDLPDAVDNSELKYFPPIGSQIGGSCSAWAGTYYVATYARAMVNDLDAKTGGSDYILSPMFTWTATNNGGTGGTNPNWTYNIIEKFGCMTLTEFPARSDLKAAWSTNPTYWKNAMARRLDRKISIDSSVLQEEDMATIKQLLIDGYLISFSTTISSWCYTQISDDPATVADNSEVGKKIMHYRDGTQGGHAMTIVGYNDNIWTDYNENGVVDNGEKGAFRVANSWGGWGDGGFVWVAYDSARTESQVSGWDTTNRLSHIGNLYVVVAKVDKEPEMVARFTLRHAMRSQLKVSLGISSTDETTPSSKGNAWPLLQAKAAGNLPLDGENADTDVTFYLDYSIVLPENPGRLRYYLIVTDAEEEYPCTVQDFSVVDLRTGDEYPCTTLPQNVQNTTTNFYVNAGTSPDPAIDVSSVAGSIDESGNQATFTLVLASQPTASVTIPLTCSDSTEAQLDTDSVTFDDTNWNTPQTVTVTGLDDAYDDGNVQLHIRLGPAVSDDSGYDGLAVDDISLANADNDSAGIVISSDSGTTSEDGDTATFTAKLSCAPTADLTLTFSSSDETEGTVSPTSLTFSESNWSEPHEFTVSGIDDDQDDGDQEYTIGLAASCGDPAFAGLNATTITMTNTDDDEPNSPPEITSEAWADETELTLPNPTTDLHVLASDDDGDALTYTWSLINADSASFSPNGTTQSDDTTVTLRPELSALSSKPCKSGRLFFYMAMGPLVRVILTGRFPVLLICSWS